MKNIYLSLILTMLMAACSSAISEPSSTVTLTYTVTGTPTNVPTFTPITPTLTFTATPPLVGEKTKTPTPAIDPTPTLLAITPLFLITPSTPTPGLNGQGFISAIVSTTEFYKGEKCQPASVSFTTQVSNASQVGFVVLSVRFKSKQTGTTSKWTAFTMEPIGAGTYSYELISDKMKGVDAFENAWVEYQFVSTDPDSIEIGRTQVLSERLTLLECELTPTPDPTATALKP